MSFEILSDDLLDRIRARADRYDRENAFFDEDLEELRAAGYLAAFVPASLGGHGLDLLRAQALQRQLAQAAPATALALNMHLVWTGVARYLFERGDHSLEFVLRDAAAGEIFAFGISEAGNDAVLLDSRTTAVPDADGGYRFTGRKIFTSLAPGWTRLGLTGRDDSDPEDPRLIYAFIDRGPGVNHPDDWDTIGMRASQSRSTVLDGAHAPAERIVRRLSPGPNPDPLLFAIFAHFELLLSAVYTGIAERALALTVADAREGRPIQDQPRRENPDVRRRVAGLAMDLDGLTAALESICRDVDADAAHGGFWFPKLSAMKVRATEGAARIVDGAVQARGGRSFFAGDELGRLSRDVRAGIFHPSSTDSTHASWARALLDD